MNSNAIHEINKELRVRQEQLISERSELAGQKLEIEDRIETIDCICAGIESACTEWERHFPQTMPMPTPDVPGSALKRHF